MPPVTITRPVKRFERGSDTVLADYLNRLATRAQLVPLTVPEQLRLHSSGPSYGRTVRDGRVFSDAGFEVVAGRLALGLYKLVSDLSNDQPSRAVGIFNNVLASRFEDRLAGWQLSVVDGLIDGCCSDDYVTLQHQRAVERFGATLPGWKMHTAVSWGGNLWINLVEPASWLLVDVLGRQRLEVRRGWQLVNDISGYMPLSVACFVLIGQDQLLLAPPTHRHCFRHIRCSAESMLEQALAVVSAKSWCWNFLKQQTLGDVLARAAYVQLVPGSGQFSGFMRRYKYILPGVTTRNFEYLLRELRLETGSSSLLEFAGILGRHGREHNPLLEQKFSVLATRLVLDHGN
jgi:hypothetical protein